jgi:hypothetical protein
MPSEKQYLANHAELVSTVYVCAQPSAAHSLCSVVKKSYLAAEHFITDDQTRRSVNHPLAPFLRHCDS